MQIHTGLTSLWQAFVDYLPNLFSILFVVFVTYYLLRFLKQLFKAIGDRNITIKGFYPDWAQPTFRLLAILIVALAGVIVFPLLSRLWLASISGHFYFPGCAIFTGFYSSRVGSEIVNYSAAQADPNEPPLVLNTTITLGYDVPWRQVHQVLLAAADLTAAVMSDPKPFVLQTSLDDFYVSYELNAYTEKPAAMARIYSELHQNIQDKCNEAGIEILSPHYRAARDGNLITIPAQYLDADYEVPAFRIQTVQADRKQQS